MTTASGSPSPASRTRWNARAEHMAAWLMGEWKKEQATATPPTPSAAPITTHADPSQAILDPAPIPATTVEPTPAPFPTPRRPAA